MSFIIAAPSSGSGKTTITLGLLRGLTKRKVNVRAAKSGPDYIDPRFHEAACGQPCVNLDAWAMSPARLRSLASGTTSLIVEGAMGLFDGAAPDGKGATADLARILKLPVVLVVDASKTAQSIAPLAKGFVQHDPDVEIIGVILNNVGSDRHDMMLRQALRACDIQVLGSIKRTATISQPSRHLGLVQAQERPDLESYLDRAAELVRGSIDLDALPLTSLDFKHSAGMNPPAQSIGIAMDEAFAFTYPHLLDDWHTRGATIRTFSPLANEPAPQADLIYLPGGYPELHAGRLAENKTFLSSLRETPAQIYGECGGYMTLGESLTDADGQTHRMAGLLPLETSFAQRKLHLGYRRLTATNGPFAGHWAGHEFHYATTLGAVGTPLFKATDAAGEVLRDMGLTTGRVFGSFAHVIDKA